MGDIYTLNVNISLPDFRVLRDAGYRLCFGKEVNGKITVIWEGRNEYLQHDEFVWTEQYEVFASNTFQVGALTQASTDSVPIAFGQMCTIDATGVMGQAAGAPSPIDNALHIQNDFRPICPGVKCSLNGVFSPIFVNPKPLVKGRINLKPVVTVMVWFSLDDEQVTSAMMLEAGSNSYKVTYDPNVPGDRNREAMYHNGNWVAGGNVMHHHTVV